MLPFVPFDDLQLTYERSGGTETGRYAEAVAFCNALAKRSKFCRVLRYGTSPEGRPMLALLISRVGNFTPATMGSNNRPLIFVQNGIHAGEIEGKDASLMLARGMLLEGKEPALFAACDWMILPVYNVDGHERMSPYNRINQNGPKEMGWRGTGQNLNLNRDYTKADAPETKAWLQLVHRFKPDFFFDDHTTDGADYQYAAMLSVPHGPVLPTATAAFQRELYNQVKPVVDAKGYLVSPYFDNLDRAHPEKGITTEDFSARYSNGYLSAMGLPSMLVETHVLKDYKTRVEATYWSLVATSTFVMNHRSELKRLNRAAAVPPKEGETVVLGSKLAETNAPFRFMGWKFAPKRYPLIGSDVAFWTKEPVQMETTIRDEYVPNETAAAPAGYAVPAAWTDVIERLKLHGLPVTVTKAPLTEDYATYRFDGVKFAAQPFESRFMESYTSTPIVERRTLPAGTAVVPATRLAMQFLEPAGPDSFMRWGLFSNVFEQKEYFEDYAMAPVGEAMLEKDAKLKAEYDAWLAQNPAANTNARLRWLFSRSAYRDERLSVYPVVRLSGSQYRSLTGKAR